MVQKLTLQEHENLRLWIKIKFNFTRENKMNRLERESLNPTPRI